MLQWNQQFVTGNSKIDNQHRSLISYINRLEEVARNTNPNRQEVEFILNLVDFVENYTQMHFAHEESCMNRHRCPAHHENMAAHGQFLEFFREFKRRFEAEGCRPNVLKELHDRCSFWIQDHILKIDMQLKPYLEPDVPSGAESK
jgi:hemerythrin